MNEKSPLVSIWVHILGFLQKISLFYLLRKAFPSVSKSIIFVDYWIMSHTVLALLAVILLSIYDLSLFINYVILIYGLLRVFEIFIYQLNVILVHPFKDNNYSIYSYRRMTISLIHNFFEIVFWFAVSYLIFEFNFGRDISPLNSLMVIYYSFMTMISFTSNLHSEYWSINAIIIFNFQALIGLFMTLLSFARFISLLPKPDTRDTSEK